jgi:hypothetical protein
MDGSTEPQPARPADSNTRREAPEGEHAVLDTCDRCGPAVTAAYCTIRAGELHLCRHCTTRLLPALRAQGWTIRPITDHTPATRVAA